MSTSPFPSPPFPSAALPVRGAKANARRLAATANRGAISRALRAAKLVALLAAVGAGSFLLLHPDPYALNAFTRAAGGAGMKGYPMHLAAYAGLAGLAAVLRPRTGRRAGDSAAAKRFDALAWPLFLAAHGLGTEALQAFVPSRTVDPWDALCNVAGVACGWAAGAIWVRRTADRAADRAAT